MSGLRLQIKRLDLAIDNLFPYTDFYRVSQKLYMRRLAGSLTLKDEEKLRELGVKLEPFNTKFRKLLDFSPAW